MCYLDDIYTYLKARGSEALPRGRPGEEGAEIRCNRRAEKRLHRWLGQACCAVWCWPCCSPGAAPGLGADLRPGVEDRLPGLRRPGQPADVGRQGGRVREPHRRTDGGRTGPAAANTPGFRWPPASSARRLQANKCDVVIGYAQGDETGAEHQPLLHLGLCADRGGARARWPASPRWPTRRCRAGGWGWLPAARPQRSMARFGLDAAGEGLQPDGRPALSNPRPSDMLDDLESGAIDAALLWGPIGGPLVKQSASRLQGHAASVRNRRRPG